MPKYELAGKGTRSDFIATPVIYKNRVYIGVGQDPEHNTGVGHFWCIDMTKKGDVSPELVIDDRSSRRRPSRIPNSAAVWHYGGVIDDPGPVKKAATQLLLRPHHVHLRHSRRHRLHLRTERHPALPGRQQRQGPLGIRHESQIWSSPYYADGKVYLGTDDKIVFVFEHGKKLKKLAENDMGGRVRATPVAANGVLVRDDGEQALRHQEMKPRPADKPWQRFSRIL